MRTETTKTTETVTVTETVYITEDGQTFKNHWEAKQHEEEFLEQQLKTSSDIIFRDNQLIPYDEWMDTDDKSYVWCKPLNETGAELLNKVWSDPYGTDAEPGKWLCYEFSDDEIYTYTLEDTIRNFEILGKSLGFKVSIEWED